MENNPSNNSSASKMNSGIDQAYQTAKANLSKVVDIHLLCEKTGAKYGSFGIGNITLDYFQQEYTVCLTTGKIEPQTTAPSLSVREQLLIMHYLLASNGTESSGKWITFQELPDGNVYYPTFLKRAVNPLVTNFGVDTKQLQGLTVRFRGEPAEFGDISVTVKAFPRVPVTIVLWQRDEEFAERGNILFDAGISNYLPTEDITILCETLAWKLIKAKSVL